MAELKLPVASPQVQQQLSDEYSWAISRLMSKSIRIIRDTYENVAMIDLLMALPVRPEFKEIDLSKMLKKDGTPLTQRETAVGGYITRDREAGDDNKLIVHLIFSKDINQSWDDFFNSLIHVTGDSYQGTVAFTYLHEAMHILMRHFDWYLNNTYQSIVQNIRPELDMDSVDSILNHGFDYWINAYLIEEATGGTTISRYQSDPDFPYLYDNNLSPRNLSQQEIIVKLAKDAKIEKNDLMDSEGNIWGTVTEITINGHTSVSVDLHGNHSVSQDRGDTNSGNEQEIGEILDNTRNDLLEKTRGSGSNGTMAKLGVDYAVPIDWFKLLKSSMLTLTQKYTNNYEQTWSKLKNKMRHVATLPGRIYYDKEMAVIVSIDQSGSMSNEDLEKVNYVVTEMAKKSVFVEILLHDTSIASSQRFEGKKFKGIREYVTNRVACGGTSHAAVFERVREIHREKPTRKLIYLSFSDNYSDIEQVYNADTFQKIPAYWIVTKGGKPVSVPGMQISLEEGLLQA